MRKFKLIYIHHRINAKEPKDFIPITEDPSLNLYGYSLYKRNKEFSFDEILSMYRKLPVLRKSDRIGVLSLLYWRYYNEFYAFLISLEQDIKVKKQYKFTNLYFYRFHLKRWVSFVRYSDDTMFPQNEIIRAMQFKLEFLYFKRKKPNTFHHD